VKRALEKTKAAIRKQFEIDMRACGYRDFTLNDGGRYYWATIQDAWAEYYKRQSRFLAAIDAATPVASGAADTGRHGTNETEPALARKDALLREAAEFVDEVHATEWAGHPNRRDNLLAKIRGELKGTT
jgi:hypothetical protein